MDYLSMKTAHIISVLLLVLSFGFMIGGSVLSASNKIRRWGFILHGISWLLVFGTAFGLIQAMGLHDAFPNWALGKAIVWILLGGIVHWIKKKPQLAPLHSFLVLLLCSLAVAWAVLKPDLSWLNSLPR